MKKYLIFLLLTPFVPTTFICSMEKELEKEEKANSDLPVEVSQTSQSTVGETASKILSLQDRIPGGKWTLLGAAGLGIAAGLVYIAKRASQYVKTKNEEQLLLKNPFGLMIAQMEEEPTYFYDYQRILKESIAGEALFEQWNGYYHNPYDLIADEHFNVSLTQDHRVKILVIATLFLREYCKQELAMIFKGDSTLLKDAQKRGLEAFLADQVTLSQIGQERYSQILLLHKKICSYNEIHNKAVEGRFTEVQLNAVRELYPASEGFFDFNAADKRISALHLLT